MQIRWTVADLSVKMGKTNCNVLLFLLSCTLLLSGFVTRAQAISEFDDVYSDLDLTEEERKVLNLRDEFVQEQDLEEYSSSESLVDEDDENGVLVLSANNFADVVKSHQHVLVEFFAPWCTHCQALAPEYSKAAVALKETGVVLAKVDAIEHGDLADDYGVEAYPTLYFFVDGEKKPYNGGRTR